GTAQSADLVFSGVSTTSDDYQLGVVWSGLAREAGIRMTVVENGTVAGMRKAARGEVDFVGIAAPHYLDAVNGTGKYTEDPADLRAGYKKMKAIMGTPTGMAQYVTRTDSGIKTFRDLKGKKVGIGRPGGNAGEITNVLFKIHGIGGQVSGQAIVYAQALEQLAAGTMDATLVFAAMPNALVDNTSRQMKLRFISPDLATLDTFRKSITNGQYYIYKRIPKESILRAYEGRIEAETDAYFWGFPYQIMVRGGIDEETVYRLTKALWENIEKVHKASASLSLVDMNDALESLTADIHPGAARYYKEKGK
ncbi:MAG: TAXI family TRAP transporter solute-binding subunit, partial [Sedimentisphaerales bacterium]|nr:TAXI family TRAP transporter solute-binding subunit [Sedimentisphaerales bacterium]